MHCEIHYIGKAKDGEVFREKWEKICTYIVNGTS